MDYEVSLIIWDSFVTSLNLVDVQAYVAHTLILTRSVALESRSQRIVQFSDILSPTNTRISHL